MPNQTKEAENAIITIIGSGASASLPALKKRLLADANVNILDMTSR